MSTLPQEILSDVLSRLPVKPLLRFRCTSKHLCAVIDGPDFTKRHLHHSLQTRSNQSLILDNCTPTRSIDLDSLDRAVEVEHPLKNLPGEIHLIGSSNGLLCLGESDDQIVIWNMSTRKHHRLPYAPIVHPNGATMIWTVGFGFGYDSVHDDYKLVRIVRFLGTSETEVMVYGLKSNSWEKAQGFPYYFLGPVSVGVLADGSLHWTAALVEAGDPVVVAFDLATEEFQVVPEPQAPGETWPLVQLGAWKDRFCVIRIWVGKQVEVWAMMQHGVKESWTKMLSTSKPQITTISTCIVPMAHLSNENEILLLKDYKKLIRFDLKRNKVKFAKISDIPDRFDTMLYVDSLVKPLPLVNVDDEVVGTSKSKRGKTGKKNVNFIESVNVTQRGGYFEMTFKLNPEMTFKVAP